MAAAPFPLPNQRWRTLFIIALVAALGAIFGDVAQRHLKGRL